MSDSHESSTRSQVASDPNSSTDSLPALSLEPPNPVEYLPSSGRRRTSGRVQDGNESDASMPSLQTVSDSSDDDEFLSDSEDDSQWETGTDEEDSDEDDEELPALQPDNSIPYTSPPNFNSSFGAPTTPAVPLTGVSSNIFDFFGSNETNTGLNATQRQLRTIIESLTTMNPFTEVVGEDPERAKTIMAKLEIVPKELVARYEKLRSGVKEGNESWERDADGCAICREAFLDNEEAVESVVVGEVVVDEIIPSGEILGKQSVDESPLSQSPSNATVVNPQPSTTNTVPADDSLRILAFPCPGMHLFHAECLAPWLARKTTCPSCRYDIDPNSLTLRLERFSSQTAEDRLFDLLRPVFAPRRREAVEDRDDDDFPPDLPGFAPFRPSARPWDDARAANTEAARTRDVEVDATQWEPRSSEPSGSTTPDRPARRQWKPPRHRDFKRWLEREEGKRDGLDVESDEPEDSSESEADVPLAAPSSSPPPPGQGPQLLQQIQQFLGFAPVPPQTRPPPPPLTPAIPSIPAIPPWEEGEFPAPNTGGFVGALRAAAGTVPRPSPLRFQAIVPQHDDEPAHDDGDDDDDDDASSMPELGHPDHDFEELMQALRERGPSSSNVASTGGSSPQSETVFRDPELWARSDSDDEGYSNMPGLIPDAYGRPPTTVPLSEAPLSGMFSITDLTRQVALEMTRSGLLRGGMREQPAQGNLPPGPFVSPGADRSEARDDILGSDHTERDRLDRLVRSAMERAPPRTRPQFDPDEID